MENNITLDTMTKEERSLLLYIEDRSVNNGCLISNVHINEEDLNILKSWNQNNFIKFNRIKMSSINMLKDKSNCYMVKLSDLAWKIAHEERKARSIRISAIPPYSNIELVEK